MATATMELQDSMVLLGGEAFQTLAAPGQPASLPTRFRGVAYGGEVVDRVTRDGRPYRLVIDVSGVTGKQRHAVNFMHSASPNDGGAAIGFTTAVRIDGKSIALEGDFLTGETEADDVARKSAKGYPWELSVRVTPDDRFTEFVPEGQRVTVNHRELEGPLVVWRKSRLRHIAVVDDGADWSTEFEAFRHSKGANEMATKNAIDWNKITAEGLRANRPDLVELFEAPDPTAGSPAKKDEEDKKEDEGLAEGEDDGGSDKSGEDKPNEESAAEGGGDAPEDKEDKKESESMTATPAPPATPPATIEQLKALKGASGDFIVECLEGKLSLVDATKKLNEHLFAQVEKARRDGELRREAQGADPVKGAEKAPASESLKFTSKAEAEAAWDANEKLRAYFSKGAGGAGEPAGKRAFLRAVEQTIKADKEFSISISAA